MKNVFLGTHVRHLPPSGDEDVKTIGIYGTMASARLAVRRAKRRVGFRGVPKGFTIDRYELGKDYWREGFVTVDGGRKEARRSRRASDEN